MKKNALLIVVFSLGLVSALAVAGEKKESSKKIDLCDMFPSLCIAKTNSGGNGSGNEPPKLPRE